MGHQKIPPVSRTVVRTLARYLSLFFVRPAYKGCQAFKHFVWEIHTLSLQFFNIEGKYFLRLSRSVSNCWASHSSAGRYDEPHCWATAKKKYCTPTALNRFLANSHAQKISHKLCRQFHLEALYSLVMSICIIYSSKVLGCNSNAWNGAHKAGRFASVQLLISYDIYSWRPPLFWMIHS